VLQRQKKQSRLDFLYHDQQKWWTVSNKSEVTWNEHKFDFAFDLSEILAFLTFSSQLQESVFRSSSSQHTRSLNQ